MNPAWASPILTVLIVTFGYFIAFGRKEEREKQRDKTINDIKKMLYDEKGMPLLQQVDACEKAREICNERQKEQRQQLCLKIEELKTLVKEADNKREQAKIEQSEQWITVARHIASVEQFMKDHKK